MTGSPSPGPASVRRFLRTIGGHRRWVLATAAISAIAGGSGIGLIAFAAILISRSALLTSTASLALLMVAVRFFATSRVVLRYTERMVGHHGTFRLLTRIRTWFFESVIPIAPRGLIDRRTGELLSSILDDVSTMQDLYLRVLVPPLVAATTLFVAVVVIGVFDTTAAVALLLIVGGTATTIIMLTRRRSCATSEVISDVRSRSRAMLIESLDAAREIMVLGAQASMIEESAQLDHDADRARTQLASSRATSAAIVAIATVLAGMAVLAIAIAEVRSGSVRGELLAMLPLVAIAGAEVLTATTPAIEALDRSRSAARRLLDIADRAAGLLLLRPTTAHVTESIPSDPTATGVIVVRDLGHTTEAGDVILDGVSFSAAPGDVVAIIGESGAGKSTLIDLLLGFDDHRGSILIAGVGSGRTDTDTDTDTGESRHQFAAVRQHDHVFDTTIRDNLAVADPEAPDDRLLEALRVAGLGDAIHEMPDGLDTRTGPDGRRLSGGERQRLIIARAVLAERPILLLDEAFEHLDSRRREQVTRSVLDHRIGRTTVIVTHDRPTIDLATTRIELGDGRMMIGTPHVGGHGDVRA